MLALLREHFDPQSPDANSTLAIQAGRGGARLSHSHATQYAYVEQSLRLWEAILSELPRLWSLAEADLLGGNGYRLRDTGQGAHRVQSAPHVGEFMRRVLGALDAQGRLSFSGRLKDMLKVGGENVAALEIEGLLLTHPAVKMAQVVGAPHDRLGEVPAAFIELSEGAHCGEEEIIEFCRDNIASFKVPRIVRFVEQWPSSATKIQKFKLIELLARPQPLDASSEAADE